MDPSDVHGENAGGRAMPASARSDHGVTARSQARKSLSTELMMRWCWGGKQGEARPMSRSRGQPDE
jgi:hypothetical protein